MAHSSNPLRTSIAERAVARTARPRPWLQSSSPAPIERPACVPASRRTRKTGPYLSDRATDKQSDTTVRQPQLSSRPRTTVSRVTSPATQLAVSQPRVSRRPLSNPQPVIAGPRTSVLSRPLAVVLDNAQLDDFDPFLDLAKRESKTARKAPTYESVMARLADHRAAQAQAAAASKPTAPLPRRAPSSTSTVSSRSTQRVASSTSTVSSTSTQRNREMSSIAWQPLLPKTKATPLPASQPAKAAKPLPAREPIPLFKHVVILPGQQPVVELEATPKPWLLPGKSCLKSRPKPTKAKKSVQFNDIGTCRVKTRWILPEDRYQDWERTEVGTLRRFSNSYYVMGKQYDGANTHEDCGCTMNVLQLTPEKHLPFYADRILMDCRKMDLNTAASARMCSTFDGTGFQD